MIPILLFGTSCDLCQEIAKIVDQYIALHPDTFSFEKSTDLHRMLSMGVKSTPALIVHEKVSYFHTVPTIDEIHILCKDTQR